MRSTSPICVSRDRHRQWHFWKRASPETSLASCFLNQNHDTVQILNNLFIQYPDHLTKCSFNPPADSTLVPGQPSSKRLGEGAKTSITGLGLWILWDTHQKISKFRRVLTCQKGGEPCRRKRLETMERSATVEKLIDLIGRGRCSIATAAGVSHSLVEDGVCHEAIQTFSSLGASGAFPGNYERDLRTWLKNLFNFSLETYSVPMRLQAHWILISSNPFVWLFWGLPCKKFI